MMILAPIGVARVGTGLTGMHSLGRLAQDLAAPRFMLPYFSDSTLGRVNAEIQQPYPRSLHPPTEDSR